MPKNKTNNPKKNIADTLLSGFKYLLFNEDGREFINDPGRSLTKHYDKPENRKKPYQPTANFMRTRFRQLKAVEIDPAKFTSESIIDVLSGPGSTDRELLFSGMQSLLAWNKLFSWLTKQNIKKDEFPYHTFLVKNMRMNFSKLDEIIKDRFQKEIIWMKNNPVSDFYPSVHQFVIEILSEFVLGLKYIPDDSFEYFHAAEEGLIHLTPPTTIFGYDFHFTSAQQEFGALKKTLERFTIDLLESNKEEILNGTGLLKDLLQDQADKRDLSLEDAFENDEVKSILAQGAKIILLNSSNFHKVLALAMLHFDEKTLEKVQDLDGLKQADYYKNHFYEAVRLTSSVADTMRIPAEDRTLITKEGETVIIPAGTMVFISLRRSQRDSERWEAPELFNPERFEGENAPKIRTPEFAPFTMGARMCPGRLVVERTVKTVLQMLTEAGVYFTVDKPEQLKMFDEQYWTVKSVTTSPQPGVQIGARLHEYSVKSNLEEKQMPDTTPMGNFK